ILRLQDMRFQQELDIVQKFKRDLAVGLDDRAIDVDLLVRLQRNPKRILHWIPSRMICETSMSPSKFSERPWRISSASRSSHRPMEIRLARNSLGNSLSTLPRSSMKVV